MSIQILPTSLASAHEREPAELLQFERVLSELSVGFVNLPSDAVDAAIIGALHRIAQVVQAERATLLRAHSDGSVYVSHSAAVEGIAPVATNLEPRYPWAIAALREGRSIAFSHLDELPAEAAIDRANWLRIQVASNATVPFFVGGTFRGALALACFRYHRVWPPAIVERMHLLATALGNALEHQRVQRELAVAIDFERLISGTLATLLRAAPTSLDELIERALGEMAQLLDADGVGLWRTGAAPAELYCTHRWQRDGIFPAPDRVDRTQFPWVLDEIFAARAVSRPVAAFPPEASVDAATLRGMGGLSIVAVPLTLGDHVIGALSFASEREDRDWPEGLLPRVRHFGEVITSVIARNRAEEGERNARAEAAHAARLGTMGVVTASLAHELTQPLAAIMTNAQMALLLAGAETIDVDELRDTLDDILADDRRAGALIQQLRRFLRRDDLEHARLALAPLLAEVLSLVRGEVTGRGIDLRFEDVLVLPETVGNASQIQQVLLNLLLNAFDAVANNAAGARNVLVTARVDVSRVIVEVRDNGIGMDPAAQARAFTPFYTTKPKGMGLGLAISRSIAEAHGGTMTLHTAPGAGSTLGLVLPVATPAT